MKTAVLKSSVQKKVWRRKLWECHCTYLNSLHIMGWSTVHCENELLQGQFFLDGISVAQFTRFASTECGRVGAFAAHKLYSAEEKGKINKEDYLGEPNINISWKYKGVLITFWVILQPVRQNRLSHNFLGGGKIRLTSLPFPSKRLDGVT